MIVINTNNLKELVKNTTGIFDNIYKVYIHSDILGEITWYNNVMVIEINVVFTSDINVAHIMYITVDTGKLIYVDNVEVDNIRSFGNMYTEL